VFGRTLGAGGGLDRRPRHRGRIGSDVAAAPESQPRVAGVLGASAAEEPGQRGRREERER
jgi:hypothetical protein